VFILGDTPEVVVSANSAFTNGSPATALTALYAPAQPGNYDGDELSARLAGFRPDLVLALSGSPTLDLWLARRPAALAGIAVLQLPPQPFQRRPSPASRCQWRDVATIVRRLWQQSWSRHRTPTSAAVHRSTQRWIDVDAGPVLTRAVLDRQPGLWIAPGLRENHAAFSLSRVTAIDATGIALLARCQAAARRYGRQFALVAPSPAVRAALADAGLLPLSTVVSSRDDAHRLAPSTEPEAGVTRSLAWCGEILAANVEDVWQMTSDYVRTFSAQGATLVFIDLARLRLLDTAGAALMLRVKRWGRSLRTEILFTHAPPHVATVLRLTSADLLALEGAQ
jgi:anti-anti-sigma regulatory factor